MKTYAINNLRSLIAHLNQSISFVEFQSRNLFLEFLKENYPLIIKEAQNELNLIDPKASLTGAFILKSFFYTDKESINDEVVITDLVFNFIPSQKNQYETIHLLIDADFGENIFDEIEMSNYLAGSGSAMSEKPLLKNNKGVINDYKRFSDFYPNSIDYKEIAEFENYFIKESYI